MKFRAAVVPLAVVLAISGCVPQADEPARSPSPAAPTPSESVSESPAALELRLPGSCDALVPLATIRAQFEVSFEPIALHSLSEYEGAQDFAARGGITCLWGIPNSDGGTVTAFAAARATDTDEQQVDAWRSAGLSECPPFLDACFFEQVVFEEGEYWTAHVLVKGIELWIQGSSRSLDPLLVVARAVATSMGYV